MPEQRTYFTSYNQADLKWAEWIGWMLEDAGHTVILQAWDSAFGGNFLAWMDDAVAKSDKVLAVLSPAYLTGRFSREEWTAALYQEKLIPIRTEEVELEGLLGPRAYIELVGLAEDDARQALFDGLEESRRKPDTQPAFPLSDTHSVSKPTRFPGSLPPIWNVPFHRNPNFTGRAEILEALHEQLNSGTATTLTQTLAGLGGIGKTQLALEYVYRHHTEYDIVWWITAEPASLASTYAQLAHDLNLPEAGAQEFDKTVRAVRRYLEQHGNWLLIFDNATTKGSLTSFLPRSQTGHVLITSRNPNWEGIASPLTVQTWVRDESITFLSTRTEFEDDKGADKLAELMGDLPLALAQASAFIAESKLVNNYADYLVLFEKEREELWRHEASPIGYSKTLGTTWKMAMESIAEEAPAGAIVLNLCAHLAPDNIPIFILQSCAPYLGEDDQGAIASTFSFDDGLRALDRYSLVSFKEEALRVHRLVQLITRDRLMDGQRWGHAVEQALQAVWPDRYHKYWGQMERLAPHIQAVLQLTKSGESEASATIRLLLGNLRYDQGRYEEAEPLLQKALKIRLALLDEQHPKTAASYNNLATLYKSQGRYKEAEPLFKKAIAIKEAALGKKHPSSATTYNNLASLYVSQVRYEEAEPLLQKALSIREAVLGERNHDTATSYHNLAELYRHQGRYKEAEPLFQKAITINEAVIGEQNPQVAASYNNLAKLYKNQGRFEEAEPLYKKAIQINVAVLGEKHPNLVTCFNDLAGLYISQGHNEKAESLYQKALAIYKSVLGEQHPYTASSYTNLALFYNSTRNCQKGLYFAKKALAIFEQVLGPGHPTTQTVRHNAKAIEENCL